MSADASTFSNPFSTLGLGLGPFILRSRVRLLRRSRRRRLRSRSRRRLALRSALDEEEEAVDTGDGVVAARSTVVTTITPGLGLPLLSQSGNIINGRLDKVSSALPVSRTWAAFWWKSE